MADPISRKTSSTKTAGKTVSLGDSGHVSIRKIANGFIVSESKETRRGFSSKETFFSKKPVIKVT